MAEHNGGHSTTGLDDRAGNRKKQSKAEIGGYVVRACDRGRPPAWRFVVVLLATPLTMTAVVGCSSDDSGSPAAASPTQNPTLPKTPTSTATSPPATSTATRTATPSSTPTPTSTRTPTSVVGTSSFTVAGHLASFQCSGDALNPSTVTLEPTGRTTVSGEGGVFSFDEVPPGDYVLTFTDVCGEFPCYADTPVSVMDADESVDVCFDICPPPLVTPAFGPPGTGVGMHGRCYNFHSGRVGYVYFDEQRVGMLQGDTPGNFGAGFVVPIDAEPGLHDIVLGPDPQSPAGAAVTFTFLVTEAAPDEIAPEPGPQHVNAANNVIASIRREPWQQ